MDKEEVKRIHLDWWGKCRTCQFWKDTDEKRFQNGKCGNPKSVLYNEETWIDGHCPEWDTFDIEVALELMEEGDKRSGY